jgi:hypothetical protein
MIVSIHQPNFMPYLGFFDKILKSNIFIIYDDAQYTKENFQNRNKINNHGKELFLTIPVNKDSWHFPIKEVITNKSTKNLVYKKHLKTIETVYQNCPYFSKYISLIHRHYEIYLESDNLLESNIYTIKTVLDIFGWKGQIFYSSQLNLTSTDATEKLVEMIKKVNGTHYLCGNSGFNYMNINLFQDSNITIIPQNFNHPIYYSKHTFLKNMCIYDYLFNNDNDTSVFQNNLVLNI